MSNHNIYALFQSRFPADRQQPVIELPDGSSYSYAELDQQSARYARLLTESGVVKGDRVAVQVEKSPQALFLYLGCLRAGFTYLPLNTAYLAKEVDYFMENAEPAAVVCRPVDQARIAEQAAAHGISHVFTLDADGSGSLAVQAAGVPAEFGITECSEDDVAVILYTSGTTGQPKGAMISHANLAANGLALHQAWGWRPGDVLLHVLPIFHIHGLFVACHCVLLNGSKMIFMPRFDGAEAVRLLPKATVLMGVPTVYTRLLAEPSFNADACRNMRLFVSGSAPLLEQTFHDFRERTGHTILERYGMTETGMNTSNPLDGERKPGTVGPALPGVQLRIVDEQGQPVPQGEAGQLEVKGPNVFAGYWRMPDKTAEEFTADGYFRTGDVAKQDADGYVSIVGRAKDMVITGGYNVYPKEVEGVIDDLPGVLESAVIGVPHPDFGEAVAAVVVAQPGQAIADEKAMIATLKTELASYKVPKRIFTVDQLPRNTMGKVQKNLLREQYAGTFTA
jgi:malonyl-CoA/methylmalonyl-CoA synthetase